MVTAESILEPDRFAPRQRDRLKGFATGVRESSMARVIPHKPKSQERERQTEDEIARDKLGGPKGSPDLPPAPLTKQEAEQILPNDDPGHVA